ncbi:N-acetyl-gamma-glutamyl-phosphate reductase [Litchfieldia salsa]|uniref:N-acetyl-gamma-glutamyl-phosphate reductase n=1 Tax=Litchfieldia salsa TaxID=930152 RepID=A0A1H0S7P2_9BACI|nr:N-acetyl-gamma-glutamyl-phosphate reductase [Litchfieldia salsa]SDP37782.1 N-acetyl-gamma-glutamyl-phosphate reductase [Litchfieldia salsa]
MKAAIIGVTGYSGIELVRLLDQHPYVTIQSVHSSSQVGILLSESYPHLVDHITFDLDEINTANIAKEVDVVFLATPSGIASKLAVELHDLHVKVIDLSGDFRLQDPDTYETWYKKTPASTTYLEKAVYGLSEWNKENIATSDFISNPGCYPTATLLGLAPLVREGLIEESSIIIDAKSGVSGAGRNASLSTHYAEINENLKIYKVNQHQHIPEIEQVLSSWNEKVNTITFSTHLIPMTRGIMATIYANVKAPDLTTEKILDLYNQCYEDKPFVRIRQNGEFPSTKEVYGSNYCDIGLTYDERTGRITIVSVIDNLVKGAAGQAIQNLNIMMGIDERTGLHRIPVFP